MDTSVMVRDVMSREFVGVSESDTVADAAALLVDEGADFVLGEIGHRLFEHLFFFGQVRHGLVGSHSFLVR